MDQQSQLKTNLTKSTYQSQFLPLVENAGMTIKKLVVFYAINNMNIYHLRQKIEAEIKALEYKLPIDLIDRQTYIRALRDTAERLIHTTYKPIISRFAFMTSILLGYGFIKKEFQTPKELAEFTKSLKPNETEKINAAITDATKSRDMWSVAKGHPRVENYQKLLKDKINGAAKYEIAPHEPNKQPISIWQKAELDIRHEHQMEMVKGLQDDGYIYCWISSHPDCSKRCQKWQGKLVDIQHHAEMSGFRMKDKVDGYTVYSLIDIMAQKDKYGYENNIINGFNCRHYLKPYTRGSVAPQSYTKEEIQKERKINATLRRMERDIRKLKQRAELLKIVDTKESKILYNKARALTERYKQFAKNNGYAWYQYRIQA